MSRIWSRAGALLLLSVPIVFLTGGTCIDFDQPAPVSCNVLSTPAIAAVPVPTSPTLQGWVDLHTHPIANLGFAGKLVYGGIDGEPGGGAIVAADPDCHENVAATSPEQALGHCGSTHGDPTQESCGDFLRALVVDTLDQDVGGNEPGTDSTGYPDFGSWPKWNELTHQVMWIDWIQRAYLRGMRVMVALAVNNQTLADTVKGPNDGYDDDKASADRQIGEVKNLVSRHGDWMAIAYQASDVAQILAANKLAVVLGLEVDNIGDFNKKANLSEADVDAELLRLHDLGVRYLFPIHVIDNPFGTTAAYRDIFNLSNLREANHFYNLVCSQPGDAIGYEYTSGNPLEAARDPFSAGTPNLELAAVMAVKLGMADDANDTPTVPACTAPMTGMVNRGLVYPGLTPLGKFAVLDMMRQGFFIDVDHMSQASATDALALALQEKYPVNSGHNAVREYSPMPHPSSEFNRTRAEYAEIGQLHGMAGVGVASTDEVTWVSRYQAVVEALGQNGAGAGFGTDANGLSPLMPPAPAGTPPLTYTQAFSQSGLGCTRWSYNDAGVANYGMLADLVQALPLVAGGADVQKSLMQGAQYFHDTWAIIDAYRAAHQADAGGPPVMTQAIAKCEPGTVYTAPCGRCLPPSVTCASAPAVCPPPRRIDEWGLCVPAATRQPAAAPSAVLPPERRIPAGQYTLVVHVQRDAHGAPMDRTQAFGLGVGSDGQVVGLDPRAGVKASGELREHLFVLRVQADGQRLALVARVDGGRAPGAELQGGFAAYAPGTAVVTGSFSFRPAVATAPAGPGESLTNVRPFLEALHR